MNLTKRQKQIIEVIQQFEPITSEKIASELSLGKSTLRNDLMVLGMLNIIEAKPNVGYYYNHQYHQKTFDERQKLKTVQEIMGIAVTAPVTATYGEVLTKLFLHDIGTVFIVNEENYLVGVISRKDMLKLSQNQEAASLPIALAMTRMPNIATVFQQELASEALQKLIRHQVDCLPVVEQDDKGMRVMGKVSKTIFIHFLAELLEG